MQPLSLRRLIDDNRCFRDLGCGSRVAFQCVDASTRIPITQLDNRLMEEADSYISPASP